MPVVFTERALRDIRDAAEWYRFQSQALEERFLNELDQEIQFI